MVAFGAGETPHDPKARLVQGNGGSPRVPHFDPIAHAEEHGTRRKSAASLGPPSTPPTASAMWR